MTRSGYSAARMSTSGRRDRPSRPRRDPGGQKPGAREPSDGGRARGPAPRKGRGQARGRSGADSQGRATLKRPGVAASEIDRILGRQPWGSLEAPIAAAGVDPVPVLERLRRYATLLIHWNRSVSNLMSQNDEQRFVQRHVAESLKPLAVMAATGIESWLDIGSGGGLPAMPLALAGLGRRWSLIESRRMKTLFLQKAKQEMGLENLEVVCARVEKWEPDERFMGVTSRATLGLESTLKEASRFVSTGGRAFLWKGERRVGEMGADAEWRADWLEDATIALPDTPTVVVSFIRR